MWKCYCASCCTILLTEERWIFFTIIYLEHSFYFFKQSKTPISHFKIFCSKSRERHPDSMNRKLMVLFRRFLQDFSFLGKIIQEFALFCHPKLCQFTIVLKWNRIKVTRSYLGMLKLLTKLALMTWFSNEDPGTHFLSNFINWIILVLIVFFHMRVTAAHLG